MWFISLLLVCTMTVISERTVYLHAAAIHKDPFLASIRRCMAAGDVASAVTMCSVADAALTRIVRAGLLEAGRSVEQVRAAMNEGALREMSQARRRTGYLALLANLAVLSGLLGTFTGLMSPFRGDGCFGSAEAKARALALGIAEAMTCTAFGLGTAILAVVGLAYLRGKTQTLEHDLDEASAQVLDLVVAHRQRFDA
jgi:biopolymer transport protein ExbB/TolQ